MSQVLYDTSARKASKLVGYVQYPPAGVFSSFAVSNIHSIQKIMLFMVKDAKQGKITHENKIE